MKKIFSYLFLLSMALCLVACGEKTDDPKDPSVSCDEDPSQEKCQSDGDICTTNPWLGEDCKFDLGGMQFVIVDNSPTTADPRKDNYSGTNKTEKALAFTQAEEKYNIKIVFKDYTAAWGDGRDNYIIQQATSGKPSGMVYNISSSSVATLAVNNAIQPLDAYIEKYGDENYSDYNRRYGMFQGQTYAYSDKTPLNNSVILYNNDMLKALGYESEYPSKLWNEGQWTWAKYYELVSELNAKMTAGEQYVMGGRPSNWAFGIIGSNGGNYVTSEGQVRLDDDKAIKAIEYLSSIYDIEGGPTLGYSEDGQQVTSGIEGRTWAMDSKYDDTLQVQFKNGKVIFEQGETWYCGDTNKLGAVNFEIGAVPYPISESTYVEGGRTLENGTKVYYNEDYRSLAAWGSNTYVISAGFGHEVEPGLEKYSLTDSAVFRIWSDLQYFVADDEYVEQYTSDFYERYYCGEESVKAHNSVALVSQVDYLFTLGGSANSLALADATVSHVEYMVRNTQSDVRSSITGSAVSLRELVISKLGIAQDGNMERPVDPEEPTE